MYKWAGILCIISSDSDVEREFQDNFVLLFLSVVLIIITSQCDLSRKKNGLFLHVCLFVCLANKQTNEENNNKWKRKLLNDLLSMVGNYQSFKRGKGTIASDERGSRTRPTLSTIKFPFSVFNLFSTLFYTEEPKFVTNGLSCSAYVTSAWEI